MVFATSETMKCFGCGAEGHLIRSCPKNILREQGDVADNLRNLPRSLGGALSPGTGGKVPGANGTAAPDEMPGVAAADVAALEGPGG